MTLLKNGWLRSGEASTEGVACGDPVKLLQQDGLAESHANYYSVVVCQRTGCASVDGLAVSRALYTMHKEGIQL